MIKHIVVLLVVITYGATYAQYRLGGSTILLESCLGGPSWVVPAPAEGSSAQSGLAVVFTPCMKLENWIRNTTYAAD